MPETNHRRRVARQLATSFLSGVFEARPMAKRARKFFVKPWPGLDGLADKTIATFGSGTRPPLQKVAEFISGEEVLGQWLHRYPSGFDLSAAVRQKMSPARGNPSNWKLPKITTRIGLARWLNLTEPELDWFSRPWKNSPDNLQHYRYHWIPKRRGGHRLIERPKDALKLIQRSILHRILDHIPPHDAVHSYRAGRSVISYAKIHCGQPLLLRLDIADFFPSLHIGRVCALFRTAGYPDEVAQALAGLCCHASPQQVLTNAPTPLKRSQVDRLRSHHLPQGAPTSSALSNLLAYRLDCRLAGLADSLGINYTRYADDLAFSGDRSVSKIANTVAAILIEEGFDPNTRKTRLLRRGQRQRLGGTIVNGTSPNFDRRAYDQLKAILHNCVTGSPELQDRQSLGTDQFRLHLQGRIAWVASLNSTKAAKLWTTFDQIDWRQPTESTDKPQ